MAESPLLESHAQIAMSLVFVPVRDANRRYSSRATAPAQIALPDTACIPLLESHAVEFKLVTFEVLNRHNEGYHHK